MKQSLSIVEVPCHQILVGERHRREMGDLEGLADSIATEGLLQAIGITEYFELVFGARRLLAVRDILRYPTIAARIVKVSSLLAGEWAENEIRKDFTASERVAIGKAIEAQLGERRGRENPRNCAELKGDETREIAAQRAGFPSRDTYERAKKVVEKAVGEIVAQMDSEQIAVSAAARIADEPPQRQREIAAMPQGERREAVRKLRQKDLPTPAEASRLARENGKAYLDRNLQWQTGTPMEERRPLIEKNHAIMSIIDAACAISRCTLEAGDVARGIRDLDSPDMDFVGHCRNAALFLSQIKEELNR